MCENKKVKFLTLSYSIEKSADVCIACISYFVSIFASVTARSSAVSTRALNFIFFTFTGFFDVVFRIDVNVLDVSLDDVFRRRHFNVQRNIIIFRNIMDNRDFDTNVIENWDLECSIVSFSFH